MSTPFSSPTPGHGTLWSDRSMTRSLALALTLLALLPPLSPACAEEVDQLYSRGATWQDSLQAALQKLADFERQELLRAGSARQEGEVTLGPWYAIGSFSNERGEGFARAYPPETAITLDATYPAMSNTQAKWRLMPFPDEQVIDLRPHFAVTEAAICYLYRKLTVPRALTITGYFGSDDGLAVWLNGEKLISQDVPRGPGADQDKADLKLKPGDNHLLLKIVNRTGGWGYYFALRPGRGSASSDPTHVARVNRLWAKVRADFTSADDKRTMKCETDDDLWPIEGDFSSASLSARYRSAQSRHLQEAAETLAGLEADLGTEATTAERHRYESAQSTPTSLEGCRASYHNSLALGELLSGMARLVSCRLAIEDLSATYGARYSAKADFRTRLDDLRTRGEELLAAQSTAAADLTAWSDQISGLQREALLEANPLLDFGKLLFLTRRPGGGAPGLPQNWQGNSSLRRTGWDTSIQVLSPVRPDGTITTLFHSASRFVGDLCLSFDATRLLFSMPAETKRDTYQLWEIGVDGQSLRMVTADSADDYDNYTGCYLPNGQIMFCSSRCYQAVPCTGGDHVALMYLMDADGRNVRQLTFDQDHSWYPMVLNDGRIVYTRWEYNDTPHYFSRILFTMNPDGTRQQALYGTNSWYPNTMMYARPVPGSNSKIVCIVSGHHGNPRMGEVTLLDTAVGEREADGVLQVLPHRHRKPSAPIVDQYATGTWPQFVHPWALSDKYFLVSCKPGPSDPWGIYLVDVFDNLVPILIQPDAASMEPIPLRPQVTPPILQPSVNYARQDATVFMFDVYRGRGMEGVPRGTVAALRIAEPVYRYWGNGQTHTAAIDGGWDVKKIWGTVPVEADGSAYFKVPANTPLFVQPVSREGMAQQQMRSWFTAMPGEVLSCVGCHENRRDVSTSGQRPLAQRRPPSEIKPWYGEPRGFSFVREVQPVLDRNCLSCHSGGKIDLRNAPAPPQNRAPTAWTQAYLTLHPYVRRPGNESDIRLLGPREFEANTSPLVQMLKKGHMGVKLSEEDWDRLITWIDLNVPFAGEWTEAEPIPPAQLVKRREEIRAEDAAVRAALAQGGH